MPGPVGRARAAAPTVAVAAVFAVTVELLRAASPLLDLAAGRIGVPGAARLALLIFAAPALVGLAVRWAGAGRATLGAVWLLVLLRLAAQAQGAPGLLVVGGGAAVGIAALILVAARAVAAGSGVRATLGVLLGGAADLAVRTAYGTWDPIWRPGALPWLVPLLAGAVAVAAVWLTRPGTAAPAAPRGGALGAYLALYTLGYGSAGLLAARAGVPLPLAAAVLIVAALAGMELVRRLTLPGGSGAIPEPRRWFRAARGPSERRRASDQRDREDRSEARTAVASGDGHSRQQGRRAGAGALVGLAAGIALAYLLRGPLVLLAVVVAALAAATLLARALTPRAGAVGRPGRYARAGLAAGLGYLLPVLIFQTHYELEFPFDNRWVLVAAAVLLGLAGMGVRGTRTAPAGPGPLLARPALLTRLATAALLVPLVVALTPPPPAPVDRQGTAVRLMSWNIRYGRDAAGRVDPEAVAAAIAAQAPDVVLLQEVSRGWPIGGAVDLAEWLGRRLGMRYEWSPAADGQFGNLTLTRLPVAGVVAARLPYVQGPMQRSFLAVTLRLPGDARLTLVNTHLQHRRENTPTRLVQSEALLSRWAGGPRTVLAGDFNFHPSSAEADLFRAAGLVSAQDAAGDGGAFTAPAGDPATRIDWIFGTPDLEFAGFALLDEVTNSDHLPLVVTVRPAGPA
jgi:endonuclease/exonuclease/phosphatase family metal-dependent hydrolase